MTFVNLNPLLIIVTFWYASDFSEKLGQNPDAKDRGSDTEV